ncbi:helix-turn-helix domain-containing protein [Microbacterium sp. P07]|uniref:helix-turn-helix domain-containing protein n=1 Tax=Microbacterium sp. P07 TaxID=3366952 RepID=UPI00374592A8
MVGLVEAYSNKSAGASHLRKLASISSSRAAQTEPSVVLKKSRQLTVAERAAFAEAYRQGANVRVLARNLGVHRSTLHELVRRQGLERLPVGVTPEQRVLVAAYEEGATLAELAAAHNMGPNRVARMLRAAGVELRSRGRRPT